MREFLSRRMSRKEHLGECCSNLQQLPMEAGESVSKNTFQMLQMQAPNAGYKFRFQKQVDMLKNSICLMQHQLPRPNSNWLQTCDNVTAVIQGVLTPVALLQLRFWMGMCSKLAVVSTFCSENGLQ